MKEDTTNELLEILFKISRRMKEEMSYTCNLTFLSVLQIQTLIFINQSQKVSMGDIAGYFGIELSSATSLINKLSKKKLIKRDEDQQDRRLVMIVLTNEGKKLLERAILERKKKLEKTLSYLSAKEKNELLTIFKTLNSKL
jgi:DNA-binding MarR family transcriptional regulator